MNKIVNKFLLAGVKFMPEMHLKQPGFTYSACGPFIRNKERIEKFIQTGNTGFIYRNELDKSCFQHDIASGKSKDLTKRTQSMKLQVIQNMMVIKKDQLQQFTAFLKKKVLILNQIIDLQMNFIGAIIGENLRDEKFIHLLGTIFRVLIQLIWNH